MNIKYVFAIFAIVLSKLCFSSEVCVELGAEKTEGHLWSIIDLPHNAYSSYNPNEPEIYKFVEVDINNDSVNDRVGEFSGGSLHVPYLVILSAEEQQSFGSDYCGAGSPKEIDIITNQGINYIYIKIHANRGQDCMSKGKLVMGYLTKYIPGDLFGEFYCEVTQP